MGDNCWTWKSENVYTTAFLSLVISRTWDLQKSVLNTKCVFNILHINLNSESGGSDANFHREYDCSQTDEYNIIMPGEGSDMVCGEPLQSENCMFGLR
jgi:hypothetical protein